MTLLTLLLASAIVGQTPSIGERPGPASPASSVQTGVPEVPEATLKALEVQVMLDRAGFSPGVIDGRTGANTKKALALYQQQLATREQMAAPAVTHYTISEEDTHGPFVDAIPPDLIEQASLPALAYTSVLESLAERFHSTPTLLRELNPQARFAAGEQIVVPNVEPFAAPVSPPEISPDARAAAKADARATGTSGTRDRTQRPNTIGARPDVVVTVSKGSSAVTVTGEDGRVIFYAPVTTGSENDPLPIGEWKVNGVQFNPPFHYNPDLFWDADPSHSKAKLPPGPNNPVGLVWIDISKEHYGIHGTPEPSQIGRTESHGCVRLTNWDALKLADMVKPGTKVVFTE